MLIVYRFPAAQAGHTGRLGSAAGRGGEALLAKKASRCSGGKISRQLILE
jgi:hypothetical protein